SKTAIAAPAPPAPTNPHGPRLRPTGVPRSNSVSAERTSAAGSGSGAERGESGESPGVPGSLASSEASSSIVDGGRRRRPPGTPDPEPPVSSLVISSPSAGAPHVAWHIAALGFAQFGCSWGPDEGNERVFVGLRRDPDGARSRARQGLGRRRGNAELQRAERRSQQAGALGALQENLDAAAGEMQHAIKIARTERREDLRRKLLRSMGAVNLDGAHREAARRKIRREISGLIASGKIEQRRALDETVGREAREITGVAARRADISEPGGAGRLPRAVADGE